MRILVGLLLLLTVVSVAGCSQWKYIPTPGCEYTAPPNPQRYLKANHDERLVLMMQAYTGQVRKTTECNANIDKVNAKNKAIFQ